MNESANQTANAVALKEVQHALWAQGKRPLVEELCSAEPEAARSDDELLELIYGEVRLREDAKESPAAEEYTRRFPNLAARIEKLFEVHAAQRSQESGRVSETESRLAAARDDATQLLNPSAVVKQNVPAPAATVDLNAPVGSAPSDDLAPGDHLGHFRIVKLLGRGGMGRVYLAEDEALQKQVAVKVPHSQLFKSQRHFEQFLTEARAASQLKHPGIVPVLHFGREANGAAYFVMEYVDGQSLDDAIKAGLPSPRDAAKIVAAVAEAVAAIHRKGYVHRDLKLSNILLDADDTPRVADFGLALHESAQAGRAGECSGTFAYMSPEQVEGKAHWLDGRADLWALGVIFYELLTGRRPFQGTTLAEMCDEILHRDPKPPRSIRGDVPAELERICLKCLAKPATARYTTADDLAADLRHWLSPRRTRLQSLAPVAVAVLAVAMFAYVAWSRSSRSTSQDSISQTTGARSLIDSFNVIHFRDEADKSVLVGPIGSLNNATRVNDQVRVQATFAQPAYCYLIAYNPDGKEQLCYPDDDRTSPVRKSSLDFPDDVTSAFRLTDGAGEQAFALVASRTALPPFREWRTKVGEVPWRPAEASGVFRFDGGNLSAVDRGTVGKLKGVDAIGHLCDLFKNPPSADTAQVLAFPVLAH